MRAERENARAVGERHGMDADADDEAENIDSSQSEREFRNLAAPQFPENRGATIMIEF